MKHEGLPIDNSAYRSYRDDNGTFTGIFPLTLKRNANQERVTFLPLIILTVSNVMRVFGDLASHVSSAGVLLRQPSPPGCKESGASLRTQMQGELIPMQ